ncbi:MAG: hypothetical protein OHK0056_14360 [Bacteriovoracaceae bacterium]
MSFYQLFKDISFQGYHLLGKTEKSPSGSTYKWQYEPGLPPSYDAQGRFRFLKTLDIEKSFKPKRVLEIAAGGGFNAICLYEKGIEIVINDIRDLPE